MVGTHLKHLNEMQPMSNATNILSGKLRKLKKKSCIGLRRVYMGFFKIQ